MNTRVFPLLLFVFFVSTAAADTILLTLDESTRPADHQCHETWSEAGVELRVVPIPVESCGLELCFINLPASTVSLALVPARLEVDLAAVPGTVHTVEAIVSCPAFAQPLRLYDGDVLVAEQLTTHAFPADTVRVSTGGGKA